MLRVKWKNSNGWRTQENLLSSFCREALAILKRKGQVHGKGRVTTGVFEVGGG